MFNFWEYTSLDHVTDIVASFIVQNSIFAPMILLTLEEIGIPMPVPGDILIAYTGYQVTQGKISFFLAFLGFIIAVFIGSSILYLLSAKYGQSLVLRLGKYIQVDEKKLLSVEKKFKKYGPLVIIFGRHIPGLRVPITIFAGMSNVSYKTFIACTFISIILWIPFYLSLGEKLGPKTIQLIHAHHILFVIFLIPFILIMSSIIYVKFTELTGKRINPKYLKRLFKTLKIPQRIITILKNI